MPVMCCRVNWKKQGFRFSNVTLCARKCMTSCEGPMFTICLAVMDAVKVVLIWTFVQMLLACLHFQIQLLYYIQEQRQRSAWRSAFLLQLSPLRHMYPACQRRCRRFWIRPGRTSVWWENFEKELVLPEEWHENFRMSW